MVALLTASRLLTPIGLVEGWVEITGSQISAWGVGQPARAADQTLTGFVSPGLVDSHSHGGGRARFGDSLEQAESVVSTHLTHGTTSMMASLVTDSLDNIEAAILALAPLVEADRLVGIHLEGPWLTATHRGAHQESLLRDPVLDEVRRLVEAGPVKMVTIAPEKPGGLAAIEWLASQGVVAAIGHTAADESCTRAAIAAGATGATHLFNGMPEMTHRSPGPVLPLWQSPAVWLELICDGVHVAIELDAHIMATKPERCVLITDAMGAAGVGDGDYQLGGGTVEVRDGVARLVGRSTLAGSSLTLDRAVRNIVAAGVPVELALQAATCHPADYLGLTKVGRLEVGCYADLVIFDDDLNVLKVMYRGQWQNTDREG